MMAAGAWAYQNYELPSDQVEAMESKLHERDGWYAQSQVRLGA